MSLTIKTFGSIDDAEKFITEEDLRRRGPARIKEVKSGDVVFFRVVVSKKVYEDYLNRKFGQPKPSSRSVGQ